MALASGSTIAVYTKQVNTVSSKSKKDANKKDSQLIIRINKKQRDKFVSVCEDLDTSAAREIRRFIKDFLDMQENKKAAAAEKSKEISIESDEAE